MFQQQAREVQAGDPGSAPTLGLVPYVVTTDTPDTTIRVLELAGSHAFSFGDITPSTVEGRKLRRQTMGLGPWSSEPDCVFLPKAGGLRRTLLRAGNGTWMGRVQIPERHALFDVPLSVPVYGGDARQVIGSHPVTGETFRVYAFQCNGPHDAIPTEWNLEGLIGGQYVYRDAWFAFRELERLTVALAAVAPQ